MRHRFLESILVCLTLAASVVSAQETPDRVRLTTSDGQVIELAEEHEVIAGILRISVEELQRRIDAGEELSLGFDVTIRDVVAVDGAVVNYDPPQFPAPQFFVNPPHMDEYIEEMRQLGEKRRQRDELHREILNETGISEGQWEQFRGIVTGIESKHEQAAEQLENSIDIDSLTPNDLAGLFIGKFIQPMHNDYRTEAVNLFGEEQYAQLAARYYQVIELGGEFGKDQFGLLPVGEDELDKEVSQLFMLPDVIDLTKEQLAGLAQIQKEFISGHFEFEIMREQEEELLKTQLSEAQTNEEQADIQERLNKVREESTKARNEIQQRLFAKARTKLDTLLTAEQKAKLSKIKADIPDYMKRALGKTTTDDTDETPTAAWRPGANSWVPGMGAPMNLKNDMREAPRIREPRDGRRFPGSE